jgi:nitrate reductase NapE component
MKQYIDDITNGVNVKPKAKDHTLTIGILALIACIAVFGAGGFFVWLVVIVLISVYQEGVNDEKRRNHRGALDVSDLHS